MYISVEISFYPLTDDFKPPVTEVIEKLRSFPQVALISNRMSTQLFGEFSEVMAAINETMEWTFERYGHAVFVTKTMNADRRPKVS
jgi:uncharacterized protein YqgV (UPF0045/DUF77 family)